MDSLQDNLLKMDETHPSLAGEFRNGRFGLKRTAKEFSRIPIDLALEQTINADAANQRTGISAFTNSISARQRWVHSHYLRISVVSHLLEKLDLDHKEDVSADLQGSKKRKNAETLKSISSHIERTLNPFSNGPVVEWLACLTFTAAIGVRIPVEAVNFHNANIYTIVPSGSNSFVLCPWMYLVFVLSTVLPSTCSLTNSDFMSCLEVIKG